MSRVDLVRKAFEEDLGPGAITAFEMQPGQVLRVTDVRGGQRVDLAAFVRFDGGEQLSAAWTLAGAGTLFPGIGHVLYSTGGQRMLTLEENSSAGRHGFFLPAGGQFGSMPDREALRGFTGALQRKLERFDVTCAGAPAVFNIFCGVTVAPDGSLQQEHPPPEPGRSLYFRAEADLILALHAGTKPDCPVEAIVFDVG